MDAHSELRLVTCLFVDVVGSTDATVRLGPKRIQRLLGDAFKAMSAEITEHGGTVEKYVGDAIFALFGATVPRVMAGTGARAALDSGIKAYAGDLRLWDRARAWDVCDLMPALALTMSERWDDLGPTRARLDEFAATRGSLAGAVAAAIREEEAAARGGPAPIHEELLALGCAGVSELLRFRPNGGAG